MTETGFPYCGITGNICENQPYCDGRCGKKGGLNMACLVAQSYVADRIRAICQGGDNIDFRKTEYQYYAIVSSGAGSSIVGVDRGEIINWR